MLQVSVSRTSAWVECGVGECNIALKRVVGYHTFVKHELANVRCHINTFSVGPRRKCFPRPFEIPSHVNVRGGAIGLDIVH